MNLLPKLNLRRHKPLAAVLGLVLEGTRLEGVVVRRQNGVLQPTQPFTATLALDPLTNDPELVGREILNQLETAGIRERHCAVAIPLKWALTAQTTLPPLTETDVPSFLNVEAERMFPCDVATLRIVTSRYTAPSGEQHATFIGLPTSQLERLAQVLRAARLKPLNFGLGITALQPPAAGTSHNILALVLDESQVSLQITCGGGVAALRALDNVLEMDSGRQIINTDLVMREMRITLGQLAPECRAAVKQIRVVGPFGSTQQLARAITPLFQSMEMRVEAISQYAPDAFGDPIPAGTAVSVPFSLAARQVAGIADAFEFLVPHISPWKQRLTRFASGKLRTAGAVVAALILLMAGAFGVQQWQLFRLNRQWTNMATPVSELERVQQQIRQYRPWFDESFRGLTILRELTLAFPEDGSVTAKTIEIRAPNLVSCSGTAHDHAALLRALNQLRAAAGVHDLKVDQIRGKSPLQFSFGFQYGTEPAHEN